MEIIRKYLTPNKYSRPQTALRKVTKIAVHYIGNAGTSAIANRNYFENLKNGQGTYASSHYIIGLDGEIIQCIPENEVAYCTNQANSYSISIENCHPDSDGRFTSKTLQSLIELCVDICKRYDLDPLNDIIRHYDVTGKRCPLWWVTHPEEFTAFKHKTVEYMTKGDDNMVNLVDLDKRVSTLENNKEKTYNSISEMPDWAKDAVNWALNNKVITGDNKGLNLSYSMLRIVVMLYRANQLKETNN